MASPVWTIFREKVNPQAPTQDLERFQRGKSVAPTLPSAFSLTLLLPGCAPQHPIPRTFQPPSEISYRSCPAEKSQERIGAVQKYTRAKAHNQEDVAEVLPQDEGVTEPLVVQGWTSELPLYTNGQFMHGLRSWNIEKTNIRLPCAKAEVGVLGVHEEVFIEEAYLLKHSASDEQDTAAVGNVLVLSRLTFCN